MILKPRGSERVFPFLNYKRFAMASLLLSGVGFSGCSSPRSSTPAVTPAVTWIAHVSKGLGFSMQIPAEWKIREDDTEAFMCTSPAPPDGHAVVMVTRIESDFLMQTETSFPTIAVLWKTGWHKSTRRIDGVSALQIDGTLRLKNSNHQRDIVLKKKGKIYRIHLSLSGRSQWSTYEPILDSMANSFTVS